MNNSKAIHKALLAWYRPNQRQLPWRKNKDPYRIWISEIMLQQTRVEAVIPYYERFLKSFPSVQTLARAPLDEVLQLWTGLGYYSRAKNLHKAAQQIVAEHTGKFPTRIEQLKNLAGIGPYTAHAIASIAFDEKVAAIDGNLERVLSRLLDLRENPKKEGRPAIEEFAHDLVRQGSPGETNQAIMDLSSAICAPKNPRCPACPLQTFCKASTVGSTDLVPLRPKKARAEELQAHAIVVLHQSKAQNFLLVARRKQNTWLSGLWDIPWVLDEQKSQWATPPAWKNFGKSSQKRAITKYKVQFHVDLFQSRNREMPPPALRELAGSEWRWQNITDLGEINLPRPSRRALEEALAKLHERR